MINSTSKILLEHWHMLATMTVIQLYSVMPQNNTIHNVQYYVKHNDKCTHFFVTLSLLPYFSDYQPHSTNIQTRWLKTILYKTLQGRKVWLFDPQNNLKRGPCLGYVCVKFGHFGCKVILWTGTQQWWKTDRWTVPENNMLRLKDGHIITYYFLILPVVRIPGLKAKTLKT